MTPGQFSYADILNAYGSDPESVEEHDILRTFRIHSHDGEHVPAAPSTNFPAVLAAVTARGPRCENCGSWSFRSWYLHLSRNVRRTCADCESKVIGRKAVGPFGMGYNREGGW